MVHARDFAPLLPLGASAFVVAIAALRFPANSLATDTPATADVQKASLTA